jgi:hypothetical protein
MNGLLSRLDDPLELLPLQAVAADLSRAIEPADTLQWDNAPPWDWSPYPSFEQEHHRETISLFIGAAFVLGQVAITQAVAIARNVRTFAGSPSWLPHRRRDVMELESSVHAETALSEIVLVDAVANYFKHHLEWPRDWNSPNASQRDTIGIVRRLGLAPSGGDNLQTAVTSLGLRANQMGELASRIDAWRTRLAEHLRRELQLHGK